MDNFITYLLQSSLCLTVFLMFYLLFLKKATYYLENRVCLILTACFSVFVPLFKIWVPDSGYSKEITYLIAPVFVADKNQISQPGISLLQAAWLIYFAIMAFLIIKFIFRLIQILLLIKNNESMELKGQKIVLLDKGNAPFTFLNRIFLTREQFARVRKLVKFGNLFILNNLQLF